MAGDAPVEDPIPGPDRSPLDIELLLYDGIDGVVSVTGAQLVAALSVLGIVSSALIQTVLVSVLESTLTFVRQNVEPTSPELQTSITEFETLIDSMGLALDVSFPVALFGLVVLALASEAVSIVGVRAFGNDALDGIPTDLATRRIAIATLSGFFGGVLVFVGIVTGLILLIVPGVIVYVGTIFFRQEVALADEGPIRAIAASWSHTKGNRWMLLVIAVALWIISYIVSLIAGVVPGFVGTIVGTVLSTVTAVFTIAVITSAYVGLRNAGRESTDDHTRPV